MNYALPQTTIINDSELPGCYHCGLAVSVPGEFCSINNNSVREFCCAGCQAITDVIEQGGFERYYELRQEPGLKPDPHSSDIYSVYDRSDMQTGWLQMTDSGQSKEYQAELLIDGITCAACVWLLESWLEKTPSVTKVTANLSNSRLSIHWQGDDLKTSDIFRQIHLIGYKAKPYSQAEQHALLSQQRKSLLKQLGVAAAFGMQIMVISVALYMGDWFGMEAEISNFLTRVNLLLTLPILFYAAKPFFKGALRSIRMRSAGMDVPVSLGLTLAFLGSTWATINNQGETYFDSVAMFVFFLLSARFLEINARLAGNSAMENLASIQPEIAYRVSKTLNPGDTAQTLERNDKPEQFILPVPVSELDIGDIVLVRPGDLVPADGILTKHPSSFDESLLTGEHQPVGRKIGDQVYAGSINCDQPCEIEITKTAKKSMLSSILSLASRSNADKPRISEMAEKLAGKFVLAVVLLAVAVACHGLYIANESWLGTTIAVLVVTCPCALSLATPLSLTATTNALMRQGVFIVHQHALETLSHVNHLIFDKTGTLTEGQLKISAINIFSKKSADECLSIAGKLESSSNHPIAHAIRKRAGITTGATAEKFTHIAGQGISAEIDQQEYVLGSPNLLNIRLSTYKSSASYAEFKEFLNSTDDTVAVLASDFEILACFVLTDQIRTGAIKAIEHFKNRQVSCEICSGDQASTVEKVASQLNIGQYEGGCLPQQKLQRLESHIENKRIIAMIGDGINDTPALGKAHLAIALARNVNLASANADILLINSDLSSLKIADKAAHRTMKIIKQNIIWALLYNASAVPLAIMGLLPPWLAGLGMSLSSIVVVMNASRLNKLER